MVSEQRKISMQKYNKSMTTDQKKKYAMNQLFIRLRSGKQKVIQKNTIEKFDWDDDELDYLRKFLPSKKKRVIIEQEQPIDYEKDLHCDMIKAYLGSRHHSVSQISAKTKQNDLSSVNVLSRVYDTKDFRKIFDDTPSEFNLKIREFIIPEGYKGYGKVYSPASLKKRFSVLFTLINEYSPVKEYVKLKHDYNTYFKQLEMSSGFIKVQDQSDTIKRIEGKTTTQPAILQDVKNLFNLESILQFDKNKTKTDNLHHILILLYTYGIFNKTIKPENIAFISRLSLNDIKIVSDAKKVFRGDGKFYNIKTGRFYLSGKSTSKTGYTYNYILPKYVRDQIIQSLKMFPREFLLDTYTAQSIGVIIQSILQKHITFSLIKNNTDYRHLFETVFRLMKIDEITLSRAIGHIPMTGRGIYKLTVIDEHDDDKRQLIVDYFKTLAKKN